MSSTIDPNPLFEWCRIPADRLENHPQAKLKLKIYETPQELYRCFADDMLTEVRNNNAAGEPTRWILPCGPTKQYSLFLQAVQLERISLHNLHIFHMDECLDWQGRPLRLDHPFSYEGWMRQNFYAPMDPELAVPEGQRHFPDVNHVDALSQAIEAVGGVDTTYGGVGFRGHLAYNEPPHSPWYTITIEEFKNSKTRIVQLNDETIISASQRSAGSCTYAVPPMAITIGMKDILAAKRVRIFADTGTWKQTVVRVALFGPVTTEFPITLLQEHPDAMLIIDRVTATAPLQN